MMGKQLVAITVKLNTDEERCLVVERDSLDSIWEWIMGPEIDDVFDIHYIPPDTPLLMQGTVYT